MIKTNGFSFTCENIFNSELRYPLKEIQIYTDSVNILNFSVLSSGSTADDPTHLPWGWPSPMRVKSLIVSDR